MAEPPSQPPPPDRPTPEPEAWPRGTLLALVGAGLILLSATLAWAVGPFVLSSGEPAPIRPSGISVPLTFLNLGAPEFRGPTLGQVLVVLGLLACAPLLLGARGRAWEIARRTAAAIVTILVVLFVVRYRERFLIGPLEGAGTLANLRAGLYLALVGSVLATVTGRPPRAPPSPAAGGLGRTLAFAALALVALAALMAWVDQTFLPPSLEDRGVNAANISLPMLLLRTSGGFVPTLGQTLMGGALAMASLLLSRPTQRGLDLTRGLLGLVVLVLAGLVAFRVQQIAAGSGRFNYTLFGLLRPGFYVALAGGILALAARVTRRPGSVQAPGPDSTPS
jgi:hypothetical protein